MTRREKGELLAECDGCGEEFPGGVLEWQDFIDDLKANGWRIHKEGEEWQHHCPECRTDN